MTHFHVVIPARHGSTRLPGKPLLLIAGKPMVARVAEQAAQSGAKEVWIATDDEDIANTVQRHGFKACLTRESHASGTDRIAEVVEKQGWPDDTIVVNVQGDEPLIPPGLIRAVAEHLDRHPECSVASACHHIHDEPSMLSPHIVKVVLDNQGHALYFSRAPIPYPRDIFARLQPLPPDLPVLRHIGIYAYRAGFLRMFGKLSVPKIEHFEALEQLRALYHGYKIAMFIAHEPPPGGVDTEFDLQTVRQIFEASIERK